MNTKIKQLFIYVMLFCVVSCKTIPSESYVITDVMSAKEITLENLKKESVFKLNIEVLGEIKGKAYILISESSSEQKNNIRIDLENKFSKNLSIDWYSDQCFINYVPVEIKNFDSSQIIIKYRFDTF